MRSGSRATATSRPSCGTPRASCRATASARSQSIAAPEAALPVNRWIIGEVVETLAQLDKAFAELRFDDMADAIYHFTWGTFCDWYVELVKGAFDDETRAVAAWAFDQILVMLHPFMPFVTEELWHSHGRAAVRSDRRQMAGAASDSAIPTAAREIDGLVDVIDQVRAMRAELNIPWSATPGPARHRRRRGDARLGSANNAADACRGWPRLMGRREPMQCRQVRRRSSLSGVTIAFPLEGAIDLDAERARLSKAIAAAEKDRDQLAARLGNPAFAERAKPEAVEKARADHDARAAEAERLAAALKRLG